MGPRWADVRITVPLTGRADSSASIGRGASSRPLSSLWIGCVGLTERPSAAPTAWEKKSPPEVSINQRGVRGDRKRKEDCRSGRTERRAERQTAAELSAVPPPPGAADMIRSGLETLTQRF